MTSGKKTPIRIRGLGETTVINALAAAAAGVACGLDPELIADGLDTYRPIAGRMSPRTIEGGVTLIDDTYNANPQSLDAALLCLSELRGNGNAIAALGAMGELGEKTTDAHRDAGARIVELGIDRLVVVDEAARGIAAGALACGMEKDRVHVAKTHAEATNWIRTAARPGDWILVKGSRAARMEQVVESLANEESQ